MSKNVYQEPFDAKSIPDEVVIQEWKKRRTGLRQNWGKHFSDMKRLTCPRCNRTGSTREMRDHQCQPRQPLTPEQKKEIQQKYKKQKLSMGQLALDYNTSLMNVWLILRKKAPKDI